MTAQIRMVLWVSLAAVMFWSGWFVRDLRADRETAVKEKVHAVALQAAERAERDKEERRALMADKLVTAERVRIADAQQRGAVLHRVADGVRDQVDAIARDAGTPAAAASGSETTTGPGMVLAKLYRSVDQETIELGIALDEARARGLACERIYDAMRSEQ